VCFCDGDEVRHGKPHPEPYLRALKKMRIGSEDAIVIENAPFGIRSAKKAGLACIALETSLCRAYLKSADFIFSSYRDLRRHLCFEADREG
jgi:beta-phosphoglucomutase-like phosphatase (HAD superfamily)